MNLRASCVVLIVASVAAMVGCGSGSGTKPEGTVSGTVTAAGQPLANVNVNFQDTTTGSAGMATTDFSGEFEIEGPLVAGSFKVYFTPVVEMPSAPDSPPPVIRPLSIADKFKALQSTDLVVVVKPGHNKIPLQVN